MCEWSFRWLTEVRNGGPTLCDQSTDASRPQVSGHSSVLGPEMAMLLSQEGEH